MLTNKLKVDYKLDAISNDFDIFEIRNYKDDFNRNIIDVSTADETYKPKSVVYTFGLSYYMLFDKGRIDEDTLTEILSSSNDDITVHKIDLSDKYFCDSHFYNGWYILLKLFVNSMANDFDEDDQYSNLTGKLYYYDPKNYDEKFNITQMLEVDVNRDMLLDIKAVTFVRMPANSGNGKNVPHIFDKKTKKFRRITKNDNKKGIQYAYFRQEKKDHRAHTDYLGLTPDEFDNSKAKVMYEVVKWMRAQNKYFEFKFEEVEVSDAMQLPYSTDVDFDITKYVDRLSNKGVRIINSIGDAGEDLLQKLTNVLKVNGIKCRIATKIDASKYNIVIIHNDKYYEDKKKPDPHETDWGSAIVQHITVEDFPKSKKEGILSPAVKVILTELLIKEDIITRHISLVDWSAYGFNKDLTFISRKAIKNKDKITDYIYVQMTIKNNGDFTYNYSSSNNLNVFENAKLFKWYDSPKVDNNIEMVVCAGNSVYQIRNTHKRVIPDIEKLGKDFVSLKENVKVDNIIGLIQEFRSSTSGSDDYCNNLMSEVSDTGSRISLQKLYPMVKLRTKTGKDFARFFEERTGKKINLQVKSRKNTDLQMSNIIGINYYDTPHKDKLSPYSYCYYVGMKNFSDLKYSVSKATLIREIAKKDGTKPDKDFVNKLLSMSMVGFVRLKEFTVLPFEYKYLNEVLRLFVNKDPLTLKGHKF